MYTISCLFHNLSDKNRDSTSSDSHVVPLQSYSKQCIFYPVKEEEREHLVEPQADLICLNSGELAGERHNFTVNLLLIAILNKNVLYVFNVIIHLPHL